MRKKYPEPSSERETRRELASMGVDVFEPESRSEELAALAFEDFSNFVLERERDACLRILEDDLLRGNGSSVGELQGGSDDHSIYRVSFPVDDGDSAEADNAAVRLLDRYNRRNGLTGRSSLTVDRIERYMLGMCDRRAAERGEEGGYVGLGNAMFIMQFGGPTDGQVRHIDNMIPNVQVCTYMSSRCPSTVVYAADDGDGMPVTDGAALVEFWERGRRREGVVVPGPVRDVLRKRGDVKLKRAWHARYFAWDTLNAQLRCFGRLYQPVAYQLGLEAEPGTTLLAGGNEIHAGPPTTGSRMFAFAIGIPEEGVSEGRRLESDDDDEGPSSSRAGENDGEVQYSPVLLHIDLCCILFGMLDNERESDGDREAVLESKRFLVGVLVELIEDHPMREYLQQIDERREGVRTWLGSVLTLLERGWSTDGMVEEAVRSDEIFYSPDVVKRRAKRKRGRSKIKKGS